jgi:hypothetical protein
MSKGRVVDVPASIGPIVFGVGVGWVTIRCPRQYDELMRRAGAAWDHSARQWLIERQRIGPVIRELEHAVDPLFAQAGIRLD